MALMATEEMIARLVKRGQLKSKLDIFTTISCTADRPFPERRQSRVNE
jgi:hypothetical protein